MTPPNVGTIGCTSWNLSDYGDFGRVLLFIILKRTEGSICLKQRAVWSFRSKVGCNIKVVSPNAANVIEFLTSKVVLPAPNEAATVLMSNIVVRLSLFDPQ